MSTGTGIAVAVGAVAVVGLVGFLVYSMQKSQPTKSQLLGGAVIDLVGNLF
jgi:hypothetical protein